MVSCGTLVCTRLACQPTCTLCLGCLLSSKAIRQDCAETEVGLSRWSSLSCLQATSRRTWPLVLQDTNMLYPMLLCRMSHQVKGR